MIGATLGRVNLPAKSSCIEQNLRSQADILHAQGMDDLLRYRWPFSLFAGCVAGAWFAASKGVWVYPAYILFMLLTGNAVLCAYCAGKFARRVGRPAHGWVAGVATWLFYSCSAPVILSLWSVLTGLSSGQAPGPIAFYASYFGLVILRTEFWGSLLIVAPFVLFGTAAFNLAIYFARRWRGRNST